MGVFVHGLCLALTRVFSPSLPLLPPVPCLRAFWISVCCTLLVTLRLLTPSSSRASQPPRLHPALASAVVWAAILGLTVGPLGLGAFPPPPSLPRMLGG